MINTQKSTAFPYTNNQHAETKIKNTKLFTITRKFKYLDIALIKHLKHQYVEITKR